MASDTEKAAKAARAARLKQAREEVNLSGPIPAAQRFGWNENTYKKHESGSNGFNETQAKEYARAFGVRWQWLFSNEGPKLALRRELTYTQDDPAAPEPIDPDRLLTIGAHSGSNIPPDASPQIDVRGGMGAGGVTIVAEGVAGVGGLTFAAEVVADYWRLPAEVLIGLGVTRRPQNIIILPVQGTSMLPTLMEGDFVFVDTRHRVPSPDGIYAIVDEFDSIVVKTLRAADPLDDEDAEPRIEIVSRNSDFPTKRRRISEVNVVGRVVRRFTADFGRDPS